MNDNEDWTIVAVTVACTLIMLHFILYLNFPDCPVQGNQPDDNPNILNVDGVWGNLNDLQNEEQVLAKITTCVTRPIITNIRDSKLRLEKDLHFKLQIPFPLFVGDEHPRRSG